MKTEITVTERRTIDIVTLEVDAGVRYWEDASVNGVTDEEGTLIPFVDGDRWKPLIDVETGTVIDWPEGINADIHYKVCDNGNYWLVDIHGKRYKEPNEYVPSILCPEEPGYGDYIIMKIDGSGKINKWEPDFSEFFPEPDER